MKPVCWMCIVSLVALASLPPVAHGQIVSCVVNNAQELRNVLDCINENAPLCLPTTDCSDCATCAGTCPNRIIIPANAWIDVGVEPLPSINLNCNHSGIELRINGTINWAGDPEDESFKLIQLDGADNVTITSTTGPARLTSPYQPCTESSVPGVCPGTAGDSSTLPTAIRIVGDCDNVTISNLNCDHLGYMVKLDSFEGTRDDINLINLKATEMAHYGYYGYATDVEVTDSRVGDPNNLSVTGTYNRHGFRFYGGDVAITNCTAHNTSNHALWVVTGDQWPTPGPNAVVDGFLTNGRVNVGPNNSQGDGGPSERLYEAVVRDVHVTGNYPIHVEMGTWRCFIFDSSAQVLSIGRSPNENPPPLPRPTDRIHWVNFTSTTNPPTPYGIATYAGYIGDDISPSDCPGNTNRDLVVDIDDLLNVISSWGTCGGPASPCKGDVFPRVIPEKIGNNVVDIDDLLAVISAWGNCGGLPEDFPNGLMDCFNIYCEGLTGEERETCLIKCFEAYCIKYPNDC